MQFFSSKPKKEIRTSTDDSEPDISSIINSPTSSNSRRGSLCQSTLDSSNEKHYFEQRKSFDTDQIPISESALNSLTTSQIDRVRTQLVEEFRCPISHMIMRDPVFTSDGETYEREEIERWLRINHTSPATNVKLTDKVLKPNIALKKAINTFLEQHPEFFDEVYFSRSLEIAFIDACKALGGGDSIKESENAKEVKKLLQQEKRFLTHRFDTNGTILHIAAQYSALPTFKVVLKAWKAFQKQRAQGVVPSLQDSLLDKDGHGWTPLHLAAHLNKDYEVISDIIRRVHPEDIVPLKEQVKKDGVLDDHFIQSVREEHYDNMLVLYALGANIEARDMHSKYRGSTALHIACSKGNLKAVQFLLENNANISARTGTHPADFSSIHFAARGGHHDIISGADIDIKCNPNGCKDWTALHLAARNGRLSALELLIQKGANVNSPAEEERMGPGTFGPAYLACFYGQEECAIKLIENGAKIEGNNEEHYLIHAAARGNQISILKALLQRGANVNAVDSNKQTALHVAAAHGNLDLVKLLSNFQVEENWDQLEKLQLEEQVKTIVDLNAEDKRGNTPLHEAASHGHRDVITFLLAAGANWKAKNLAGRTPAEEASKNGKKDISDDLLHEVKRVKAMRIQHTKPLQMKVQQQEKQLKEQQQLIEKQQLEINKCNQEIEELKKMVLSLMQR